MSAVACTAVEYLAGAGVDVHPIICKLVAFSGGIGALVSTAAGVFAPALHTHEDILAVLFRPK